MGVVWRALDRQQFAADYAAYAAEGESKPRSVGEPFLLKRRWARTGVLLIHGYLAAPEEVRLLGEFLHRHGFTVYGLQPRTGRDLELRYFRDSFDET